MDIITTTFMAASTAVAVAVAVAVASVILRL
jgi:hypothetical protein